MDIKQKSITALKWEIAGKFVNPLIFLASTVFLSRLLEPEHFGQFAVIQIVVVIIISLLDFGFGIVLIQKQAISEIHFSSVFWLGIIASVIVSFWLLFFSSEISFLLFNNQQLADYLKLTPFCILIGVYINNQTFRLKKEINFSIINIAQVISALISGALAVFLAFNGFKTWSLVIQLVSNYVVQGLIFYIALKWRIKFILSYKAIRELWGMGWIMFLGNGIEIIYYHLDSLIISKIFPARTLGYYNRSKSLDSLVINFTSGTLSFLLPAFSLMQDDKEKLRNAFVYVLHGLSTMIFLIIGLLYLCASDVVIILFGSKWINSIDFFKILVLGSYAYPLGTLLVNFIISSGQSKVFIKNEIVKKILLSMAFLIGFQYGINGYLYSFIVLAFFGTSLNAYYACKTINIKLITFYKHVYKYVVVAMFLVIILKLADTNFSKNAWLHLISVGSIYSILYIALLYVLKIYGFQVFRDEIVHVFKKKMK
jgi:O-antigen/teichoic acid export membrane protein